MLVQDDIFDSSAQLGFDLVIDAELTGIDDAHGHAGLDGVIQKDRVNGFAHRIVAAERERDVGDAARDMGVWQIGFDPAYGFDEVDSVAVVLRNASGDSKDVRVKDDVFGRKAIGDE